MNKLIVEKVTKKTLQTPLSEPQAEKTSEPIASLVTLLKNTAVIAASRSKRVSASISQKKAGAGHA